MILKILEGNKETHLLDIQVYKQTLSLEWDQLCQGCVDIQLIYFIDQHSCYLLSFRVWPLPFPEFQGPDPMG